MGNLFLMSGEKYVGNAIFINGYNGYNSTEYDGMLCAVINNSCFGDNQKPNMLVDINGLSTICKEYRGQKRIIK